MMKPRSGLFRSHDLNEPGIVALLARIGKRLRIITAFANGLFQQTISATPNAVSIPSRLPTT